MVLHEDVLYFVVVVVIVLVVVVVCAKMLFRHYFEPSVSSLHVWKEEFFYRERGAMAVCGNWFCSFRAFV